MIKQSVKFGVNYCLLLTDFGLDKLQDLNTKSHQTCTHTSNCKNADPQNSQPAAVYPSTYYPEIHVFQPLKFPKQLNKL